MYKHNIFTKSDLQQTSNTAAPQCGPPRHRQMATGLAKPYVRYPADAETVGLGCYNICTEAIPPCIGEPKKVKGTYSKEEASTVCHPMRGFALAGSWPPVLQGGKGPRREAPEKGTGSLGGCGGDGWSWDDSCPIGVALGASTKYAAGAGAVDRKPKPSTVVKRST